mgnify:CR=1 FL=1
MLLNVNKLLHTPDAAQDVPVSYTHLTLPTNNKAGVLLCTLEASTTLHCVCDRCAKPFTKDKTVTYQCVLAQERQSDDDEDIVLLDNDEVDLGEVARTAFILEMDLSIRRQRQMCIRDSYYTTAHGS